MTYTKTYKCNAKTVNKFYKIFNEAVFNLEDIYLDDQRMIGLIKIDIKLTDNGFIEPKLGYLKSCNFLGKYKVCVKSISSNEVYKFNDIFVSGVFLKKSLKVLITKNKRYIDIWIIRYDYDDGCGVLALGNENGLIFVTPLSTYISKYYDFKEIFKEVSDVIVNKEEKKVNDIISNELVDKWFNELFSG